MSNRFEDIDSSEAIILYDLIAATYKIAPGKTLLELAIAGKEAIE
ncbi:hypothetical protein [Pontibacter vulgaris]|nr:hypothetical protein [Pontibacter vulgaris]